MAQRAHRRFGQVYAYKLLKSQRKGLPLYHQRMQESYQKKREST